MTNLIINGIDHSVFDLEWAKRGGVVMLKKHLAKVTYVCNISGSMHVAQTLGQKVFNGKSFANVSPRLLRMATPAECAEAGVEYIEPPARWLPIESAPKNKLVLLYRKTVENDLIYLGGYQDGEWCTENGKVTNEPHYWMPLKLPNALAQAEEQNENWAY